MSGTTEKWHYRTGPMEERFGLLDNPNAAKFKRMPVFSPPVSDLPKRKLTAFGITSGVGSMLIGAHQLGFSVVGNVEWRSYYRYQDSQKRSTLPINFPGAFMARGLLDVPKDLMPNQIDFAAGHPECGLMSGLSHSVTKGKYKEIRGTDAADIPLFLKMVAELRPRFFLMDDLPAAFDPLPMSEYIKILPDYDLFPEWISNWGYENIQKRRDRMFIVGALKTEKFTFQPGERVHSLVLSDVIGDLVDAPLDGSIPNHCDVDMSRAPGRYVNLNYFGHRPTWDELKTKIFPEFGSPTQIWYHHEDGTRKSRPGTISPRWDGFCPVLSGQFNPIHPVRLTPLTVRERARIQGFPDSFVFYPDEIGPNRTVWEPYQSDGQRGIKMSGKAMPIQFCTYVADQVKHHILGKTFKTTGERVLKPNIKVSAAKMDYCRQAGYADQSSACSACWLNKTCEILNPKLRKPEQMELEV